MRVFLGVIVVTISVLAVAQDHTTPVDANTYAYAHWRDWRIYHIGDRIDGYEYMMLYKASDGCHLQTLDTTYNADTSKCGNNSDGWGKIETVNSSQVATIIPTTKKGKTESFRISVRNPQPRRFHDTLAELKPSLVSGYDKVVAKLQTISTDPTAPPDGYPMRLTIDRVYSGTFRSQCGISAHSDHYQYELTGRSESDCNNLPAPHQSYWSRDSQQSALSVALLNPQDNQNPMQYVDIVLSSGIDEYHGKTYVKKTTFIVTSKSSL